MARLVPARFEPLPVDDAALRVNAISERLDEICVGFRINGQCRWREGEKGGGRARKTHGLKWHAQVPS